MIHRRWFVVDYTQMMIHGRRFTEDNMQTMINIISLDAQVRCIVNQELEIADAFAKEGRSLVIVANKMDLLVEKYHTKEACANDVQRQLVVCLLS